MKDRKVLVLGASENPSRYSYMAALKLMNLGHKPILLANKPGKIGNTPFVMHWPAKESIHTITIYLNPKNQLGYYHLILNSNPQRVIFNPGAENQELYNLLKEKGINALHACTLVMLNTNQF